MPTRIPHRINITKASEDPLQRHHLTCHSITDTIKTLLDAQTLNRYGSQPHTQKALLYLQEPQADQLARTLNMILEAIDDANRQRATKIINAQEEECKRVARELHDETSQVLTSLLISLISSLKRFTVMEINQINYENPHLIS